MNMNKSEPQFPIHQRVKIYVLGKDNQWLDCAVGYFQLVREEQLDGALFMRVLEDPSMRNDGLDDLRQRLVQEPQLNTGEFRWELNLRVTQELKFESQGENIMTFVEGQDELALSFKDSSYMKDVLQATDSYQGRKSHQQFRFDEVEDHHPVMMPSHSNLEALQTQIQEHPESIIQGMINNPQFFEQLKKIFDEAEDLENEQTLEALFHIFRSFIYLKNEKIMQMLMSDNTYLTTFGVLEFQIITTTKGGRNYTTVSFLHRGANFIHCSQIQSLMFYLPYMLIIA